MQLVPIVLLIAKGIKNVNNKENAQGSLVVVVKLRHHANGLLGDSCSCGCKATLQ